MKISKSLVVMGMALFTVAGTALADQSIPVQQQNFGKRPLTVDATAEKSDQAWEGTSLKVTDPAQTVAQTQRQQINLRFASKRAYQ